MKRMIRILQEFQRGSRTEALHDRPQQFEGCELVTGALQKQHRNPDLRQVLGALLRRTSGRVQRERKECEANDTRQWRERLSLRCHATTERPASGDQWQSRHRPGSFSDRSADSGVTERRRIGTTRAALHVWKLITQGRDPLP